MSNNLGDAYLKEQARLRSLMRISAALPGAAMVFYCGTLEDLLKRADRAAMEQDIVAMVGIYQEMQAFKG